MRLKYIRAKELADLLGVNKSTIWRWVKEKSDFPKPRKISKVSPFGIIGKSIFG